MIRTSADPARPSGQAAATRGGWRRRLRLLVAVPVLALGLGGLSVVFAQTAAAHGSTVDPPSRNYGCDVRWGGKYMPPERPIEDPMCDQAWLANPDAMYNWNGLYRENVGGQHQKFVPDGTLCSGGNTANGRYDAMDVPGPWVAKTVNTTFPLTVHDGALHGADYYRVYVTKPGFDPVTQKPKWSDLQLVKETRKYLPGEGTKSTNPKLTGVDVTFDVSVPANRTGRAIIYTIWQASHLDQPYYLCSDVIFKSGGGTTTPPTTPPTTVPPTTVPPTTEPPVVTPPTTTVTPPPVITTEPEVTTPPVSSPPAPVPGNPTSDGCTATYKLINSWPGAHLAEVTVVNGSQATTGWKVTWNATGNQMIQQIWSGVASRNGGVQTVDNAFYNGTLAPGASTTFGLIGLGEAPLADVLGCSTTA